MDNKIIILRVDPTARTIVPMKLRTSKNATNDVRRITRTKRIGWRELLTVEGTAGVEVPLVVAGGLDVDEAMSGWRIRGGEDTAGIGILFGKGPGNGMIDCPVDRAWVENRIEWLEGEDVEAREERARATIDMLDEDLRQSIQTAMVLPDGMWLSAGAHKLVGDAMLRLGFGTERTKGQKLTPLGESLYDILTGAL